MIVDTTNSRSDHASPSFVKFVNCRMLHSCHAKFVDNVEVTVNKSLGLISCVVDDAKKNESIMMMTTEEDDDDDELELIKVVNEKVIDCKGHILSPGFIDLQLNGAFGIDFSNSDITRDDVKRVAKEVTKHGVTSFCPTLVSCSRDRYRKVTKVIGSLCHVPNRPICSIDEEESSLKKDDVENGIEPTAANVLGIHLEGPFFAMAQKGAHAGEFILDPVDGISTMIDVYGSLESVSLVTLAPELPGALDSIRSLSSELGIVVAMGHSDATLQQAVDGVHHGATLVTHLFNAMKPFHHREPGLLGLLTHNINKHQTNEDESILPSANRIFYSIIVDGQHSHPSSVKLAYRANSHGAVLVTDAISATGLGNGTHSLGTMSVEVIDSRATLAGTNILAGSVLMMDNCVQNYLKFTGCSTEEALRAATLHPALVLKCQKKGKIMNGYDADLVLLHKDSLNVLATWVGGKIAFIADGYCFTEIQ